MAADGGARSAYDDKRPRGIGVQRGDDGVEDVAHTADDVSFAVVVRLKVPGGDARGAVRARR